MAKVALFLIIFLASSGSPLFYQKQKPIYVRWHRQQTGQGRLSRVTFTYEELKAHQVKTLLSQAISLVEKQNP
ncbi:MAG: hypothetical protein HC828_21400 [Blastochloris sp.]|nr:hypothetical protein [Blastochloris sp.]